MSAPSDGGDPTEAVLRSCNVHRRLREGSETFLVSEFVDKLFPVAQGLTEAGTSAFCIRYVV